MGKFFVAIILLIAAGLVGYEMGYFSIAQNVYEDGEYLGFIRSVEGDSINFDEAKWLSGKEGEDAAIRNGDCTEAEREYCMANNFYIDNPLKETMKIDLSNNTEVVMVTWKMQELGVTDTPVTLVEFAQAINNAELYWSQLPYRVTISNDTVVRIEEVYVP